MMVRARFVRVPLTGRAGVRQDIGRAGAVLGGQAAAPQKRLGRFGEAFGVAEPAAKFRHVVLGRRAMICGTTASFVIERTAFASPVDSLLARIAAARANVKTLRGPFVQTRSIELFSTSIRSTGMLLLLRPDRLRWELAPPDAITFWVGPEGLSYRDAHGQARLPSTSAQLASALEDLHTMLGGDPTSLERRWELGVLRDDRSGAQIAARPRSGSGVQLTSLEFTLAPDWIRPTRVVLSRGSRDRTVIEFGELEVNAPIDPSLMRGP